MIQPKQKEQNIAIPKCGRERCGKIFTTRPATYLLHILLRANICKSYSLCPSLLFLARPVDPNVVPYHVVALFMPSNKTQVSQSHFFDGLMFLYNHNLLISGAGRAGPHQITQCSGGEQRQESVTELQTSLG